MLFLGCGCGNGTESIDGDASVLYESESPQEPMEPESTSATFNPNWKEHDDQSGRENEDQRWHRCKCRGPYTQEELRTMPLTLMGYRIIF